MADPNDDDDEPAGVDPTILSSLARCFQGCPQLVAAQRLADGW
jgi:hypothetical protein